MHLRLAGGVSEGSGAINEDGWGYFGDINDTRAAWVFDGVTGINERNYVSGTTDAHWLVTRADWHLRELTRQDIPLADILSALVDRLSSEFRPLAARVSLPQDYDPPAACVVIVKRYRNGWQALRLGDSCLFARGDAHREPTTAASPDNAFDHWLAKDAQNLREGGITDTKELLSRFQSKLRAGRQMRNKPSGYGILECDRACLEFAQYMKLANPTEILLCTDGFYRVVDHYQRYTNASLLDACVETAGLKNVLAELRRIEREDADCRKYPRLKPSDDATAVALVR